MKRSTLLLFLLLLPLTMAPRTSMTPVDDLDVVLVASRTTVQSGDVVNVAGQVRNSGAETAVDPVVTVHIRTAERVAVTLVRATSGCAAGDDATSTVVCAVRDLRPGQQAGFSFALRFGGEGQATLTTTEFATAMPSETVTVTVAAAEGRR